MLLNESGKWTFSKVAEDYDAVRPLYPADLVHTLIGHTQIDNKDPVLEIGCGTGQLTRALAPYGLAINAIDIGIELIRMAEKHCHFYSNVHFALTAFEDLVKPKQKYKAIISATAFHWLDPNIRFRKCAEFLQGEGYLILVNNVSKHQEQTGPLRQKLDVIYESVIPEQNSRQYVSLASKRNSLEQEFGASPYFDTVNTWSFPHIHRLATRDYIKLLNTFSYQHNLPTPVKNQLFQEVEMAVREAGGFIDLPYEAVMLIAKRKNELIPNFL